MKHWHNMDEYVLQELRNIGVDHKTIGFILNRSPKACQSKAKMLEIKPHDYCSFWLPLVKRFIKSHPVEFKYWLAKAKNHSQSGNHK